MTVRVALGEQSYDIAIENGALDRADELLAPFAARGRFIVVTDKNIIPNQLYRLKTSLTATGINNAVSDVLRLRRVRWLVVLCSSLLMMCVFVLIFLVMVMVCFWA